MLSSAKNMIYLFQKADGLQGRKTDPDHVKGQFCRAEGQRKRELSVCLQSKLSFSCITILVHLFFYPSSSGNMKHSCRGKDSVCPSQGEGGMGEGELREMCAVSFAHG